MQRFVFLAVLAALAAGCGSSNESATTGRTTTAESTPGVPIYAGLSRDQVTTAAKSTMDRLRRDPASDYYHRRARLKRLTKTEFDGDPAWLARFAVAKTKKPACLYLWSDLFTNDWRDASFAFQPCP